MAMTARLPVVLDGTEDRAEYAGRTDVLFIVANGTRVELPQFGIRVDVEGADSDAVDAALERAVREMLVLYRALSELPSDYINDVERAQTEVFAQAVAPWLLLALAEEPDNVYLPRRLSADLVGA